MLEKQKYHAAVHVGLQNLAGVFQTTVKRCRANDNHVLRYHLFMEMSLKRLTNLQ